MEPEKQKPKDTLLDREIKQETEDFLERVKETEEECSKQIVSKLEIGVALSASEEAYQLGYSNVLEQEEHKPTDLFEKEIKEEAINEELVDKNCFEQFVPKLEEVIEPCLTEFVYPKAFQPRMKSNLFVGEHNPVQTPTKYIASSSNQKLFQSALIRDDVKLEPIDDVFEDSGKIKMFDNDISRNRKIAGQFRLSSRHRCILCLEMKIRQNMKTVTVKNERLVLMVGFVLSNRHTYEEAQSFLSRRQSTVCHAHFSEASETIYKSLQIGSCGGIATCSNALMKNLMITVKILSPKIVTLEFQNILRDFALRNLNEQPWRIHRRPEFRTFSTGRVRCSVCSQVRNRECLNIIHFP